MALRLIELVLPEDKGEEIRELLKEHHLLEHRQIPLPEEMLLVRILLDAEKSDVVLDLIEQQYADAESCRIVVLPVEATLPRIKVEDSSGDSKQDEEVPERIGREELYEDIKDAARCTRVFLSMTVLATVVATVGLLTNSVVLIIGAMVIAPLLGPNIALALATTLGDLSLLRHATLANLAGIALVIMVSVLAGFLLEVDPSSDEIVARTHVEIGDVVVALASGCAGALSFTMGTSATLIGVMVAVALLPPLVTFGLLLGSGDVGLAWGAFSLCLMNLICINLAAVTTFLAQGIRPSTWWEKDRASKATRIAMCLWGSMLALLSGLVYLLQTGLL